MHFLCAIATIVSILYSAIPQQEFGRVIFNVIYCFKHNNSLFNITIIILPTQKVPLNKACKLEFQCAPPLWS